MTDFLLELRSEEIPARMQGKAREDLARLFAGELAKAGLTAAETVTYATPRRLALIARGLPDATRAVSEEVKGPRAAAPPQALEGFLRKTGLTREQLVERDGVLFAVIERPGRATADVLADAIPAIVRAFPWPKSMRWGEASTSTESLRWVRPLQGIVALFGDEVVPCEVAGIASGAATVGHRFHHPGVITIGSAGDYVEKLRACHVIVDQDERATIIATGAQMLAAKAGLMLVRDEGLLIENAGLTEWPMPLLGRFDPDYLSVPPEVIQLTARVNQKYFVCTDGEGKLANAFICVANIDAKDGGAKIVEGNRKVLAARLSDARFFYETDLKTRLEALAPKLEKIVFHEKLGTVADKVDRVAKLARWLVEEGIVKPAAAAPNRSSRAKSRDLGTRCAGCLDFARHERGGGACEFGRTRRAAGEGGPRHRHGRRVPRASGCHRWLLRRRPGRRPPRRRRDPRPLQARGAGRCGADRPGDGRGQPGGQAGYDFGLFAIDEKPTGSKDPFALRRAALGVLRILGELGVRFPLSSVRPELVEGLSSFSRRKDGASTGSAQTDWWGEIVPFFADRLKVQQREAGVRHDLIDAVFALGGEDDLVRLLARVHALQAFVATPDGANLLAGYKRAANILKKEGYEAGPHKAPIPDTGEEDPLVEVDDAEFAPIVAEFARSERAARWGYDPEPAERALSEALDAAEPRAKTAVEAEDFAAAMAALASLRPAVDAFFDSVTVNDADPARRSSRLALLARMRDAVHNVADFSKIEG